MGIMLSKDGNSELIECSSCTSVPKLGYRESEGLRLVCECPGRVVDIDDSIETRSVFHPISGVWSTLDY